MNAQTASARAKPADPPLTVVMNITSPTLSFRRSQGQIAAEAAHPFERARRNF